MGDVRIDARALVDLIQGWADGDRPLYRLLADGIGRLIESGDLPAGARLPPERQLALALPGARGTVVAAYKAMAEAALVERRQGSGTTVAGPDRARDRPSLAAGLRAQTLTGRAIDGAVRPVAAGAGVAPIELGLSVLDDPTSLPAEAFEVDRVTLTRAGRGHGYAPLGIRPLRERVAELLTERVTPTTPDQVAITLGVQHGIALAVDALAAIGGVAVLEDPTYPGAIDVLSRAGLSLWPVRADVAGTDPAALRSVLDRVDPQLVYLMPQCASPTGAVTTPARCAEIGDLLSRSGAWLIEDAALEFLVPQGLQTFLTAMRPERSVLLGTVSKVFWGGLRVGWLRAPEAVIERVARARAAHDLGSSIATQVTALRLLDDLEAIGNQRRAEASLRRAHLADRIREQIPQVHCTDPGGGLSLWLQVPDAERVVHHAARVGLDVVAGPVCSIGNGCTDRLRISAWAPIDVLDEAVARLGAAVDTAVPA